MSDSEEDYMSDKIIKECAQTDVRPGLLFRPNQKRSLEIYKKELELRKKPKPQEKEKERRDEGLQTAISSNNKGFEMLKKMGYKPGTGLGKSSVGITEPVAIEIKVNSSGLGREQHVQEIQKKKISIKENYLKVRENDFLQSKTEKLQAIFLRSDVSKAQRLCEDLDMKQGIEFPEHPQFWQKATIVALKEKMKKKLTDMNDDEYEEDDYSSSSSSEDEEEPDKESLLKEMISYLRTKYKYCMYCGDFFEDESECPGYFRSDHD